MVVLTASGHRWPLSRHRAAQNVTVTRRTGRRHWKRFWAPVTITRSLVRRHHFTSRHQLLPIVIESSVVILPLVTESSPMVTKPPLVVIEPSPVVTEPSPSRHRAVTTHHSTPSRHQAVTSCHWSSPSRHQLSLSRHWSSPSRHQLSSSRHQLSPSRHRAVTRCSPNWQPLITDDAETVN